MNVIKKLETRRDAILKEMGAIHSMKRGTINEQFFEVPQKGQKKPALRGPYYVFSRREGSKTVSHRLKSPEELKQAQNNIAQQKHFVALCREFEELTERLGELTRQSSDLEEKKKPRKSRSNRTGK